jgi:hypothetical protein
MRKTMNYVVIDEGRDKGKIFVITEFPASHAEAWATRALLAIINDNAEIPEGFERLGMAGMAELGIKALAGLKWEIAEPLLEEMWQCVKIMPDKSKPNVVRDLIESDIEEVLTRVKIRAEIWKLHTDFLKTVAPLISGEAQAAVERKDSPNTKTSHRP